MALERTQVEELRLSIMAMNPSTPYNLSVQRNISTPSVKVEIPQELHTSSKGEDVKMWLDSIGLGVYTGKFLSCGYDTMSIVRSIDNTDLVSMDISNIEHRNIILNNLPQSETSKKKSNENQNSKSRSTTVNIFATSSSSSEDIF